MTKEQNIEPAENEQETPEVELSLTDEELQTLCAERICPGCPEKAALEDDRLRLLADADNTRKRLERDKGEFQKFAAEKILSELLPVLDNLDLALQHAPKDDACKNFVIGVQMTHKMFLDTLAGQSLEPVGEVGETFSPEIHEAVGEEERTDMEPGCVASLMKKGYRLNGRLLRAAMVTVSKAAAE